MPPPIVDQVIDLYEALFEQIFAAPFRPQIPDRLKRNIVVRQVQESADAASQALTRFFVNQQVGEQQVQDILAGFAALGDILELEAIANPNVSPETVVERLLVDLPCPGNVERAEQEAIYRVALHSLVQVLMLVGPVMAEWQRLSFASTFELPRRVVNRLNQISEQLDVFGRSGQAAADDRYELLYRDYLLQRFHRVEAGTVRMTTSLDVDLRELFVMPRVRARQRDRSIDAAQTDSVALMDLRAARAFLRQGTEVFRPVVVQEPQEPQEDRSALEQVKSYPKNVLIGAPGSGKSTFFEWLQVKVAAVEEELVLAGRQAIPLLLRMRQLDPRSLPQEAELIEKATASRDRATLMPPGWINRQMDAGRVLFMVDGLDEVDPVLRDRYVIPWLVAMNRRYPLCRYLISSRPVGYAPGSLRSLEPIEYDLLDFDDPQIAEYTRHWCTAVRLARNEPEDEARREGSADGDQIVAGFTGHPYIRDLARNPLMLSAICLVNYFEGGELPKDRAVLYRLCVEGLLHHWDQRRGIRSEYGLDEKLRLCREVALAMQANDRAEYGADQVQEVFSGVLGDGGRAERLLEHIRYRTGLLLERRPGIFAFAHLTFQEYLAARAVHEGNRLGIGPERLVREHADGRWEEVIALYCGLAPAPAARATIEYLVSQPDSHALAVVLAEAYLSTGPELTGDQELRGRVLARVAVAPGMEPRAVLDSFPESEATHFANYYVGNVIDNVSISQAYIWLSRHPNALDTGNVTQRLLENYTSNRFNVAELMHLIHSHCQMDVVHSMFNDNFHLYSLDGPDFKDGYKYGSQGELALWGLVNRDELFEQSKSCTNIITTLLEIISNQVYFNTSVLSISIVRLARLRHLEALRSSGTEGAMLAAAVRRIAQRIREEESSGTSRFVGHQELDSAVDKLSRLLESNTTRPPRAAPRAARAKKKPKRE